MPPALTDGERRQIFEHQRAACVPAAGEDLASGVTHGPRTSSCARSIAPTQATIDALGGDRHGDRARGDRAARLRRAGPAPDPAATSHRRLGRHRVLPPGRQPHDPRRGRGVRAGRRARRHQHRAVDARHVRRAARRSLHGARRARAGDRRRRPRHVRAAGDGLPGVVAARVVPGHGEEHAGLGQRAGRARRPGRPRRRRRVRRRRRRGRRAREEADEALALSQARIAKEEPAARA